MNASFRQAIMDAGMTPPDHIRAGCWERFPGLEKKTSNRAGFCFLFGDLRGGVFGDFSTEFKEFWHLGEEMSLAEQATARKQIKEAQRFVSTGSRMQLSDSLGGVHDGID